MNGNDDLRALVRQFIEDDARQRVDKMVTGLRAERLRVKWDISLPKYGVVNHFDELPDMQHPVQRGQWLPFRYPWEGKIHWLDLPLHGSDSEWSGYKQDFSTYKHTFQLDHAIWCEYAADPYGPQVPVGHTLEVIGNKGSIHEKILAAGYHCVMVYYKPQDEAMSVQRQYSVSFIHSFGLPGDKPVKFDTLDAQIGFLNQLVTESGPDEEFVGRGNSGDKQFLKKLKAKCYAIKDSDGPFASKFAFDVYKETARYIDGGVPFEEIA